MGTGAGLKTKSNGPVTAGAAMPVPVSVAVCGELASLSVTVSVAEKLVAEAGVKVTEIVHCAPAASVVPQVVAFVVAKSAGLAPAMVIAMLFTGAVPVFESVAVSAVAV